MGFNHFDRATVDHKFDHIGDRSPILVPVRQDKVEDDASLAAISQDEAPD